ncbi:MAG: aminotransferase class I/II-fold pyridoxal phosphate-dependent enzyme [Ignavibacteriales bacterium]|nr:aminotransferase class I/II-fold pyridoxal phosphate-dependent enzyme [Ignavibacteriales bacterium]
MKNTSSLNIESKCVHSGIGKYEFGSVVPPIYQTSTFEFESAQHGANLFAGKEKGYIYTRMLNPTVEALENCVAQLEGGYKALGCASGMAAVHTVFAALLKAGDHVVCSSIVYGPTTTLLSTILAGFGVETTFVDTANLELVKQAIKPNTKVVYVETPANPTLSITDLEEAAKIAHNSGAKLVVDNTFLSPVLQRPFEFGADVILHSMTKFLNGHADVVAGIIIVKDEETYKHFRKVLNQLGGVIDPFNSFLVHRGIKTLSLRMKKHCENAQTVAEHLEKHPLIEWVKFPGLPNHPQYELAKKQQDGFGGIISFEVKGGYEAGEKMMNSVTLCKLAVSLGGVESLIQHPASMTHQSMGKEARAAAGITDGLVRLSVGIENVNDILACLDNALEHTQKADSAFEGNAH